MAEARNAVQRGRPTSEPRLLLSQRPGREPVYYIHWHDGERQRKRTTGTGEPREADKIFARWLLDQKDQEQFGIGDRPRYPHEAPIAEVLSRFADERGPEVRVRARIGYAVKRLMAWWGDRCVDAIIPVTCNAYRDARLKQGVALATIIKELSTLRAALRWAKKNGRLITIPDVITPPKPEGRDRFLSRNEAARLLWAARQEPKSRLHLPLFILLGLYTGARSEAILTLKWFPQVNLEAGTIDYNPPGRTRTKKGRAFVPIHPRLLWFLKQAHARAASPYVLSYHGEPIKRIVHSFRNACLRAGLEGVTPHTLRHTCGTWMGRGGKSLHAIGGMLGHSDPRTTKLYAHHHPDHLRDRSRRLR